MLSAWDINARSRHEQILKGKDVSFAQVLTPKLLEQITNIPDHASFSALDVGCGTGVLAHIMSGHVRYVAGIDPSRESVEIAEEYTREDGNVTIKCINIEEFANSNQPQFDLVIANMVLQAITAMTPALVSISRSLKPEGVFLFSIPHPCFWATHRPEIVNSTYAYHISAFYEIPFTISNDPDPLPSSVPYYHRPLEEYSSALCEAGFVIEKMLEPFPDTELMVRYPARWQYPRFLIFNCRKWALWEAK